MENQEEKPRRIFINCEKCGKRLIERLPNGLWKFMFGKGNEGIAKPPVQMLIYGSVKIMCLRRGCDHVNTLDYLPFHKREENQQDVPHIKREFIFSSPTV